MDASTANPETAPRSPLPLGTVIDGRYRVTDVIGQSLLCVTYLAQDLSRGELRSVTEFYPAGLARRTDGGDLHPIAGCEQAYAEAMQRFDAEGTALARVSHPNLASIADHFTANGTAYRAMAYEQGRSLASWLGGLDSPVSQLELDLLFGPLLDAIGALHSAGEVHGQITPDQIRIRYDGTPELIRLSAAPAWVLSHGYAAPEQYTSDGAQIGPWTDLYMLAACIYRALTGHPPPDAAGRYLDDTVAQLETAAAGRYRAGLLAACDRALRLKPRERPQSAADMRRMFFDDRFVSSVAPATTSAPATATQAAGTQAGQAAAAAGASAASARPSHQLSWHQPHGFVGLSIVNFLLRIVTLGIYSFWGRTEVRKRIWSGIRLDGEPLEYTGTGRELMSGFFIIFGIILVPYLIVTMVIAVAFGQVAMPAWQMASYAIFLLLYGIGTYRAQRYRLSRTRWRGIRGSLAGSSWSYGWTSWWTLPLLGLTLGWLSPWRATRLQSMLVSDMRFGTLPFRFTATSRGLYGRFAVTWIGTALIVLAAGTVVGVMIPIILDGTPPGSATEEMKQAIGLFTFAAMAAGYLLYTIANAWYRAGMINHFSNHTHIGGATLRGTATTGGVLAVTVTNALITLLTLGLLAPVAQARWTRYLVENTYIDGNLATHEIAQADNQGITRGEGLAQAFDLDAF